ncbi:hypothetical protein [Polycladomyces subterraneus]|uniref:Uncharacterized protein n=1 Tax=Polycladomyces subterraneus TaxID=1016997 RepID=A0ABT8ILQ8_9BACL|nr:hypothetical protein [Polycladomyces subterraneus]MDN4593650.1 hypothetical protein [Polycladomyces subterraneus]
MSLSFLNNRLSIHGSATVMVLDIAAITVSCTNFSKRITSLLGGSPHTRRRHRAT